MRKPARILLWTLAVLLGVAVALVVYLRNADLSVYEDRVEAFLSEKIGHRLDIDGLFELHVNGRATLVAENITLTNADWPSQPLLVSVGHVLVTVDLWSLLDGPVIIEDLDIREVLVNLDRDSEGHSNWDTGRPPVAQPSRANEGRIVFRDIAIEAAQISYADAGRPRPIDVSLESLTISPDENDLLDLDLQGMLNEFPLRADGKLGPWQNLLGGNNLIADLDLTLGAVHLAVSGSIEDAQALAGVDATLSFSGPTIDVLIGRLGLPPFAEGPFQIDGKVQKSDGKNEIRLEGNLGEIDILADGSVDRLLDPGTAQFHFDLSGPDSKYLAEVFGISGVPEVPFEVVGDFGRSGKRLSFADTRAKLGANAIALDGWLDAGKVSMDLDLTINSAGPNFSVFAPFIGVDPVPGQAFDVDGHIVKSGADWQFEDVTGRVGENRVTASGAIAAGADTELVFSITGPDNTFLQAMTGLEGLPARPYDIQARLRHEPTGLNLQEAVIIFGDHRAEVQGIVGTRSGLAGTRLDLRVSGPELKDVALVTKVPYLPGGPFVASGQLQLNPGQLVLQDATATVGELTGTATGTIGLGENQGEFDLAVSANGPDVAGLADFDWMQQLAGDAVSVSGHVRRKGAGIDLESVAIAIGSVEASLDGTLSFEPLSNSSDLQFHFTGPDLDRLASAFDLDIIVPARPFSVSGRFDGTPSGFGMQDFSATIGDNDISGAFDLNLKEKPRLTGSLSSTFLDLTETQQHAAEQEEDTPTANADDEDEFLFSRTPLDTGVLQAADIDIDVGIDRLVTHLLAVSDVRVGVKLMDGTLQVQPFSFVDEGGSMRGQLLLTPSDGAYTLDASLTLEEMRIGFSGLTSEDRAFVPPISGQLEFQGAGRSVHDLMATSNGMVRLRQGSGRRKSTGAARIFGDLVLTILRKLNPLRGKQEYTRIDCGIYDIRINDGIATIDKFAVQTEVMTTVVAGGVRFGTEQIDLIVRAKPREGLGISIGGVANSFFKLGGTLKAPVVQVDPKGTVVSGGVGVATGGISLLAKGLLDRVSAAADICKQEIGKEE